MNTWKYIKNNVSDNDIERFEALTKVSLPAAVEKFIIEHNNGRPSANSLLTPAGKQLIFEKLLSFNETDLENVFTTYTNLKSTLPSELLPVALDPFGNYFCLNAEHAFRVDYWMHESGKTSSTGKDLLALVDSLR